MQSMRSSASSVAISSERHLPNLHFLLSINSENAWSDLLATLMDADQAATRRCLGIVSEAPLSIRREVAKSRARKLSDRPDLVIEAAGRTVAIVEVKLLAGLGDEQLERYYDYVAEPQRDACRFVAVSLQRIRLNTEHAAEWDNRTWEDLLEAFVASPVSWVATTAAAWLRHITTQVPTVDGSTAWNDIDGTGLYLALRLRSAYVYDNVLVPAGSSKSIQEIGSGGLFVAIVDAPILGSSYIAAVLREAQSVQRHGHPRRRRHRALPARVMVYFAVGMGLYCEGSYEDVLAQLTDGLSWASGWAEEYRLPSKSAIFQARRRLGSQPLADLFARVARPLGAPGAPGVWVAGRRLVAVDETCLDVADSAANDEYFGRAGVNKGEQAAFSMARLLAVAECGTHAIFAAKVGAYAESEGALAGELLPQILKPGMLLTADRGFCSYALWRATVATGADLLWRVRTDRAGPKPEFVRELPDGTWLAHLRRKTPELVKIAV